MIKITADSTCDLSPEIIKQFDISLIPLHVLIDDEDFRDGIDIEPKDIFRYVGQEGKSCKTAAVNTFEYENFFKEFSPKYDAVIHISLGSGFSSCYQNAKIASEQFDNVYVVDSQNLSTGSGHIVYEAALLAQGGVQAEEIVKHLEELVPKVDASFVINTMEYLRKGGRCSGVEAFGATLLRIKPSIEVVGGKMIVGKKYRGNFDRCIVNYVKDRLENNDDIDYSRVFITHSYCSPETVQKVREAVETYAKFDEIIETTAGCTISTHCGPNTLGILYKRKSKK
ncbi:DegV family protein [Ureibacillus thermophilus]|uniref:DegV family protein n=1 Tax=Ureibacillus thermophilus TaxID=367743 RepID=A0A4P6UXE7_9BACL|nr:DegV family protein [Ureibacillus thermophilus]QBK27016.1 DegV family protein [Ureibacillus thermophilus]